MSIPWIRRNSKLMGRKPDEIGKSFSVYKILRITKLLGMSLTQETPLSLPRLR